MAFVDLANPEDKVKVLDLNGEELNGNELTIEEPKHKNEKHKTPKTPKTPKRGGEANGKVENLCLCIKKTFSYKGSSPTPIGLCLFVG